MAVGFHTTARCTTGTVSLGSRGRCFFKAGAAVEAEEGAGVGDGVAQDRGAGLKAAGETEVIEIILTGMAIGDWEESLTLEVEEGSVLF